MLSIFLICLLGFAVACVGAVFIGALVGLAFYGFAIVVGPVMMR